MATKTTMVQYKTTDAYGDANQAAIRAVFAELRSRGTRGVRYACHRLPDGVTFVHIATFQLPADGPHPITSLPAFGAFQAGLKGNTVASPSVTELLPFETYGDDFTRTGDNAT
jgi:hypothetical protein